jgi:2-methylcitrate dehydratase
MSWNRVVEKFHWLSERFADEELRNQIINAAERLDSILISDLTDLLAQIRPSAVFPRSHPGIQ